MRLLLVNAHGAASSVGGTEKHLERLGRELVPRGYEVAYLSAFPGESTPVGPSIVLHSTHWREDRVRRLRNHVGDVVSRPTRRLAEAVASLEPTIVHTHNLPGISTSIWEVCRRLSIPVVHTLHDYHLLCPRVTLVRPDGNPCRPHPLLCGLRTRRLARWADAVSAVIAVSEHLLKRHEGIFRQATTHVVRNPVAPPKHRRPPASRTRAQVVGYLGGLSTIKGVEELLAAGPGLAALGCTVRIAGDGPLRATVEEAAARVPWLQYEGVVAGEAKDLFVEECDVGILPSVWEEPGGPPNAMVEWLSAGKPVLVSSRGGLAEAIELFPGAIAIEPTPDGIVESVRPLVEPTIWRDAQAAIKPVTSMADEERWIAEHERIYHTALGDRR